MKKNSLVKVGIAMAAAVVVMTGCGNNTATETAATTAAATEAAAYETKSAEELTDEAKIVLGDYTNLTRTIVKTEITESYVQSELEYLASMYPVEITGRPAQLGDTANIDYAGYEGDVAFDGGTGYGYDLVLGSGSFIDGFEDGVVGMEIGEERDLNLKFPEQYHSAELAGKEVVFKVKLNSLASAEGSKVDDDLAKRVMGDEAATLEMLKADVQKDLELQAEYDFYVNAGAEVLMQLVENSEITVDPDAAEQMLYQMTSTYQAQADVYGFAFEDFLSYFLGMTPEDLEAYATEVVKQEMVLNALIEKENLSATDEQKDLVAQMNGFENAAALLEQVDEALAQNAFNMGAANYFLLGKSTVAE